MNRTIWELKQAVGHPFPWCESTLNRTIWELKHRIYCSTTAAATCFESYHLGIETALSNICKVMVFSLNRTIWELKLHKPMRKKTRKSTLNRTIWELKLVQALCTTFNVVL